VIVVSSAAAAFGAIGDAGQLVEDEQPDHREEHDRHDRPDDLEARRAVDLRAFGRARTLAAAVLDDERDQHSLDPDQDDSVKIATKMKASLMRCAFGECADDGRKPPFPARATEAAASATTLATRVVMAVRRTPVGIV
jgi:hypothetical protein